MKVVYSHCAGIDIHKDKMTVCVFAERERGTEPEFHRCTLPTHSQGVAELEAMLRQFAVTDVGLESTGVYWKPVWNALEGRFGLHLCNPEHVRAIPGSKTDQRDGKRLAELLAYGKLPESFIPPLWQRELRDLTRMRTQYMRELSRAVSRIQKVLEDAQIKLASVVSDVLGVSGRKILAQLVAGNGDEQALSELAQGSLKRKKAELRKVLRGAVREHHRFQLRLLLESVKHIDDHVLQLERRIDRYLEPYQDLLQQFDRVPGIDRMGGAILLAEIGPDMSPWESDSKLAAWACICPGNKISAGKRLSGRMRRGNPWLRRFLCQAAWAASRTKHSYFHAQFRRLSGRRGARRANMAVAHSILIVIYHLAANPQIAYQDLGVDFFDKRDAQQTAAALVKRLGKLGYEVTVKPRAA
jgi:transposase